MHPVYLLAFATFVLILGLLAWNKLSVKRQKSGGAAGGIGGSHDPLSGASEGIRNPDELRASMEQARQQTKPTPL